MTTWMLAAVTAAASMVMAAAQETPLEDHWAIHLGQRIAATSARFPVVDQVVLVPDPAAYLQELGRWSPEGIWPVLIEDDLRTPQFIQRFDPARVIRRSDRGSPPQDHNELARKIQETIITTWGGHVTELTRPQETFAQVGHVPSGVILASGRDPAWTAAVALASARGQVIGWLDGSLGAPSVSLGPSATTRVIDAFNAAVRTAAGPPSALGHGIETVTICREMAARATAPAEMEMPADDGSRTVALTDLLGRDGAGRRHLITGWILGDETQAAAMAMSSIFLARTTLTCLDTYPAGSPWETYAFDLVDSGLSSMGYDITVDEDVTLGGITSDWTDGLSADIVLINSRGNADFFDLFSGRGGVGDLPLPTHPVCVSMIHSWSAKRPDDPATIAGALIGHGAYAYVGSVHEPYIHAFVPPAMVAQRLALGVPFLVATRWWPGEGTASKVWRIATIGDPQMTAPPPAMHQVRRRRPPDDDSVTLESSLRSQIATAQTSPAPDVFAAAISLATTLGRDDMAAALYQAAVEREMSSDVVAVEALESLHRTGSRQRFLEAYQLVTEPTPRQQNLLWSTVGNPLDGTLTPSMLDDLIRSIRPATAWSDVQRLAPVVKRMRGPLQARAIVQAQIDQLDSGAAKNQLKTLLRSIR